MQRLTNTQLWTPRLLRPSVWIDASVSSSITVTAGGVSRWEDLSSSGWHFTQSTSSYRPILERLSSGMPVVSFYNDATNPKYMGSGFTATTTTLSWVSLYTNNTGFNAQSAYSRIWSHYLGTGNDFDNNNGICITHGVDLNKASLYRNSAIIASSQENNNRWNILSAYRNGTAGGISADGNDFNTGTTASASNAFNNTRIGNDRLAVDCGMYGSIAESLCFTRALSLYEFQKVQGYLAHKWGFEYLLPSTHPYRNTPPLKGFDGFYSVDGVRLITVPVSTGYKPTATINKPNNRIVSYPNKSAILS